MQLQGVFGMKAWIKLNIWKMSVQKHRQSFLHLKKTIYNRSIIKYIYLASWNLYKFMKSFLTKSRSKLGQKGQL
jgi:hypothetical protein